MKTTPASNFQYRVEENTITITKFIGSETEVVIPDEIDGLPVRKIEDWVFLNRGWLTSITLPEGLETIGDYAFSGCTGLTEFVAAENNAQFKSVDGVLFTKDGLKLVAYPAGVSCAYTIPEGVKTIGDGAFYNCTGLTSITFPKGLEIIGSNAFHGCTGLTSITLPEGVKIIRNYTFYNCTHLTSVRLPEGVKTIGYGVFQNCTRLTSMIVPEELVNDVLSSVPATCYSRTVWSEPHDNS